MYDFNGFKAIIHDIRVNKANRTNLADLRDELNNFFRDAKCIEVIYTANTDGQFFGMAVLPVLEHNYLVKCIDGHYDRFKRYIIELDSKLFNPLLVMTDSEITAILLHEVGHVVNSVKVSKDMSEILNVVIYEDGIKLERDILIKHHGFFEVGVQRTIRKLTSIFCKNDEEYIADAFVVECGFGKELESAYDKITRNKDIYNKEGNRFKVASLLWGLQLHTNLAFRRKAIIDELKAQESYEGSQAMKRLYKKGYESISKSKVQLHPYSEGIMEDIKYSDIRKYESDLYEYAIRMKHIESEAEAIDILKELNYRIDIISDYLESGRAGVNDIKRMSSVMNKYISIREELSRNPKYTNSMYGLFVKHPEIRSRYDR